LNSLFFDKKKETHFGAKKNLRKVRRFFFAQFGDCSRQQFGWRDVGRVCTKFGKSSLRGGHTKKSKNKDRGGKKSRSEPPPPIKKSVRKLEKGQKKFLPRD
jgi:hypothetical protein